MSRQYATATTIIACVAIITLMLNREEEVETSRLSTQGAAVVERSCFNKDCVSINGETSCHQSRHNCEPLKQLAEEPLLLSQQHRFFDDGFPSMRIASMDSFEDHHAAISHLLGVSKAQEDTQKREKAAKKKPDTLQVFKSSVPHSLKIQGQPVPGPSPAGAQLIPQAEKQFAEDVSKAKHQYLKALLAARAKALKTTGQNPEATTGPEPPRAGQAGVHVVRVDPDQLKKMLGGSEGGEGLAHLAKALQAAQKRQQEAQRGGYDDDGRATETSSAESTVEKVMAGGTGGESSTCVEKQCILTTGGSPKCATANIQCDGTAGPMKIIGGGPGLGGLMKGIAAAAAAAAGQGDNGGVRVLRIHVPESGGPSSTGGRSDPTPPTLTKEQKAAIVAKLKEVAGEIQKKVMKGAQAVTQKAGSKKEGAEGKTEGEPTADDKAERAPSSPDLGSTKPLQVVFKPGLGGRSRENPAAIVSERDYQTQVSKGQKAYAKAIDEARGTGPKEGETVTTSAEDKEILSLLKERHFQ